MLRHRPSWILRYGIAVLSSCVAVILTQSLWQYIQPALYLFFLAAVMISSWVGGFGPGIVSMILGALFSEYFFLPPIESIAMSWENLSRVSYFASVAVLICILNSRLKFAQRRAESHATEAQQHQALLLQNQEILRQSEERYRLLVKGVTDYAIFMLNPEGLILSWSVGAEKILGYREDEVMGQPFSILFTEEAIAQQLPQQILQIASSQGFSRENRWHIRKDRTFFWSQCTVEALHDEAGHLRGFSKIMQDITVRKQVEEERNRLLQREQMARQEAESANRAKDEFLAVLSHELRTPLTAITGWVGMLRSGKLDSERSTDALEIIERNATIQMQLVEDLLDVSRIIRGDLWLDRQPVDLLEVVAAAIAVIQPRLEEKQLQLNLEIDSSFKSTTGNQLTHQTKLISVIGDPERLQQVILNLLSNAVKFTPKGGAITICLSTNNQLSQRNHSNQNEGISINDRNYIQLQVKDTGIGIKPEFLPYVFDRFRQADSSNTRSHKGLGLGLAIARYLVEQQGGTIAAESLGEGLGATFTVTLPLLEAVESTGDRITPRSEISSETNLERLSVLILEDDIDTRNWLANVFRMHQAKVTTADFVDAAIAHLNNTLPDIVISDIAMPGKDGYAFIAALKQREKQTGKFIPAIALTAHASPEDIEKSLSAGFQQHLAKPIKAESLINAAIRVIEQRNFQKEGSDENFDR